MSKEKILLEYDTKYKTLENISQSVVSLIKTLLTSENIVEHTVSDRVKDRESLVKKIDKKDKYTKLDEITDIVGIRIITHYSDDVDTIATLLENEFLIDEENSIDKRQMLDPDRFGYLSLHYVASFNKERLKLMEYKAFKGIKFEIQIRSILQHTWAEIEHDIGYKSKAEVPKSIRRQFSRLAGLLEIADSEFISIRKSLSEYEIEIEEKIRVMPENVLIDTITLTKFIKSSELVSKLDNQIIKMYNFILGKEILETISRRIAIINYLGIKTIQELSNALKENEEYILLRAKDIGINKNVNVSQGISLFYLLQILAIKDKSEEEIKDFITFEGYDSDELKMFLNLSKRLN